jgi:hypothetical protein
MKPLDLVRVACGCSCLRSELELMFLFRGAGLRESTRVRFAGVGRMPILSNSSAEHLRGAAQMRIPRWWRSVMDKAVFSWAPGDTQTFDGGGAGRVLCSLLIDKCAPNGSNYSQIQGKNSRDGRWLILLGNRRVWRVKTWAWGIDRVGRNRTPGAGGVYAGDGFEGSWQATLP